MKIIILFLILAIRYLHVPVVAAEISAGAGATSAR